MWLKNKNEPILEPILRKYRFGLALSDLKNILNNDSVILDYGCGPEAKFYEYLKHNKVFFKKYIGVDPLCNLKNKKDFFCYKNIKNVNESHVNIITMFAVIEHLEYPLFDYFPIFSLLDKGDYLLFTTPTKIAKPLLEFLSIIGIVSKREIKEHKHYFSKIDIEILCKKYHLNILKGYMFECFFNFYYICKK